MTKNMMKFQNSEGYHHVPDQCCHFLVKLMWLLTQTTYLATLSSLLLYLYLQPTQPSQYIEERLNFLPNPVVYAGVKTGF